MKYFSYSLKDIGNGEKIGPAAYLPIDAETGRVDVNDNLYGRADIESLDCIADFRPVEIEKYAYPFTADELFAEKVNDGYSTGLGYKLGITDQDRAQWTAALVLYREANLPDTHVVTISDTDGHLHELPLSQFRALMVMAGSYYQTIWSEYKASQ